MTDRERRRHVRLKPTADAPARAVLASNDLLREALDVVDISIGGIALTSPALRGVKPTQALAIVLVLGGQKEEHQVKTVVSWAAGEIAGAEFVELTPAASHAIDRYVSDLLERGASP